MGICADELREYVIEPTLQHSGSWSEAAENLLMATAAQASGLGFHLLNKRGRGFGIFQISANCHLDIWDHYLVNDPELASHVRGLASQHEFLSHPHAELATNLSYSTALAWMVYQRCEEPLPEAKDIEGMAEYWAKHWGKPQSRHHRHAKKEEFIGNYQKYVSRRRRSLVAA